MLTFIMVMVVFIFFIICAAYNRINKLLQIVINNQKLITENQKTIVNNQKFIGTFLKEMAKYIVEEDDAKKEENN